MANALAYTYCTQSDMEQILSSNGVTLRADDDSSGSLSAAEQARITDAINGATETVNYYCRHKHTEAMLATSMFVNRAAAWLACYEFCATRGNEVPESILDQAEKWEEKLDAIWSKGRRVPGLPFRMSQAPTMDNTRVDPRYQFRVIRVERKTSSRTNTTMPVQTDFQDAFISEDWMI